MENFADIPSVGGGSGAPKKTTDPKTQVLLRPGQKKLLILGFYRLLFS